jgi:hypothetical protein
MRHLTDAVQSGIVTHDIKERIRELEGDIEESRKELQRLQLERANTSNKLIQSRIETAIKIHENRPLDRLQLNTALKALLKHMVLNDDTLEIHWVSSADTTELLIFPSYHF